MAFAWSPNGGLPIGNFIAGCIIIAVIYGLLFYVYLKVFKRNTPLVILAISAGFVIIAFILNILPVLIIVTGISVVANIICLFVNMGDLRNFLANPFSKSTARKPSSVGLEKIYDRKALYKTIETAVIELSNGKVGAIMTFERNNSLKDVMRNGVAVHAPVSVDLLLTIFYNGTRLHDGAVVIHGNEIVSAAVFFTPTTEPFAGKYGSRHRAAIGISEISDSITVVVSEETGRISLAVNGELETVDQSNFLRVFENYMDDNEK